MTVAVMTNEGSTSPAPVTSPGTSELSLPAWWAPVSGTASRVYTRQSSRFDSICCSSSLRDLGKFTIKVPLDLTFVPQTKRLGVSDDPEGGNCSKQQGVADLN